MALEPEAPENPVRQVSSELNPWPVARLSQSLKDYISRLGTLWVEGELANISLRPTQLFGAMRDLQSENSIEIHAFDLSNIEAGLKQGDRVIALLKPDFWAKNGKLTMRVLQLRRVGLGELIERIEAFRAQIFKEGLAAPERKQPLPFLPRCIGLVTGKDSDAEKDVLTNARLRWPEVRFRVVHSLVQGDAAVPRLIEAIELLDADPEVDVIIVARGGGSFQDLMIFSDERLVRVAAATKKPLVSAIGHENDRPVLDEVADLRASTPTDAAKRVVPDIVQEREQIVQLVTRVRNRMGSILAQQASELVALRSRPVLKDPGSFVLTLEVALRASIQSLRTAIQVELRQQELRLTALGQLLTSLSPQRTLDRGYAVVRTEDKKVVSDATTIKKGQRLLIRVANGELEVSRE